MSHKFEIKGLDKRVSGKIPLSHLGGVDSSSINSQSNATKSSKLKLDQTKHLSVKGSSKNNMHPDTNNT